MNVHRMQGHAGMPAEGDLPVAAGAIAQAWAAHPRLRERDGAANSSRDQGSHEAGLWPRRRRP